MRNSDRGVESAVMPVKNRSPEAQAWLDELDRRVQTPEFWDVRKSLNDLFRALGS